MPEMDLVPNALNSLDSRVIPTVSGIKMGYIWIINHFLYTSGVPPHFALWTFIA